MTKHIKLQVQPRTSFGRKLKQLRKQSLLPANIFGKSIQSKAIQLDLKVFNSIYEEAGETSVIEITLDGDKNSYPVLISNIQFNPVTDVPVHVDFRHVDMTQKITANIPLEFINESPAAKDHNAVIITNLEEVEVEALPDQLPEKIEVDLAQLKEVGDAISIGDIKIPQNVELTQDLEIVIVLTQEQREQEVEAPAEEEANPATEVTSGGEENKADSNKE